MNWRAVIALAAALTAVAPMTTGCVGGKIAVRAVARGAPAAAPFFRRALALGADVAVGEALSRIGGEREGDAPGLYGGTRHAGRCDKARLVEFLQRPENRRKAEEWAKVQGLDGVDEIGGFVKGLTPVLLRGDTLVKNHDYKKGRANAFDALLQAGIAVLVDRFGEPAVQCSCGNPLSAFDHEIGEAQVRFDGGSKKWPSYEPKKVTKVKSAGKHRPVEVYQLVDIEAPGTGLARATGSDGADDRILPESPDGGPSAEPSPRPSPAETTATAEIPDVRGMPLASAQALLEERGFKVGTTEEISGTATPGTVVGQGPEPGVLVADGALVTLVVAANASPAPSTAAGGLGP
jgi:hypothetical protein